MTLFATPMVFAWVGYLVAGARGAWCGIALAVALALVPAHAENKITCKPDQSGRLTVCCKDEPPDQPSCDWRKNYCVCSNKPVGYGY
jgi:hypothetical protein